MADLVRKYKISKLGLDNLSEKEQEIINFVKDKLLNLSEFTMSEYPDKVFYMNNNGEYILEYNIKTQYLYVKYDDFWEVLENRYKLKYADIKIIIQYMVESTYKSKITTTIPLKVSLFP